MLFNPMSPEGHSAWEYAQELVNGQGRILTAIQDGRGDTPTPRRVPFTITCDASGNGESLIRMRQGARIELTAIAFQGSTSGVVCTYINESGAGHNLIKANPSSQYVSDTYNDEIFAADNVRLTIAAYGQTASTVITGNIRFRQYDVNPNQPKPAV